MKGIGIMGGTFDPIHMGHLLTAEYVRDAYGLEKVLFIPAANSPFKLEKKVESAEDRLAMTRLAVADNPHFARVSPIHRTRLRCFVRTSGPTCRSTSSRARTPSTICRPGIIRGSS